MSTQDIKINIGIIRSFTKTARRANLAGSAREAAAALRQTTKAASALATQLRTTQTKGTVK